MKIYLHLLSPVLYLCVSIICLTFAAVMNAGEPTREKGSWITFLSHRSSQNLLYRMRPDGSELETIFGGELLEYPVTVEGLTLHRSPHWTRQSPDRKFFLSYALDHGVPYSKYKSIGRFMVYLGRTDTRWSRVIAPDGEEELAWSPDSLRFAYAIRRGRAALHKSRSATRLRSSKIILVGIDGSNNRTILDRPGIWIVQDWSPDGNKLLLSFKSTISVYSGSSELFELDLSGIEKKRISASSMVLERYIKLVVTDPPLRRLSSARYSPEGNHIAAIETFSPKNERLVPSKLHLINLATHHHLLLAEFKEGLRGPICWSPDGREVLFSRYLPLDDKRERLPEDVARERLQFHLPGAAGLAIWAVRISDRRLRFVTTGWSPDWR